MIFIESILTILAWRKGWRWWALLSPILFLFANLVLSAETMELWGLPKVPAHASLLVVDLLCSAILLAMAFQAPPSQRQQETVNSESRAPVGGPG